MWILRPDALVALEDPLVKRALTRYVKILKENLPAKFLIAKKIPVNFSEKMSEEQLWKIHEKGMKKFREVEEKVDSGKIKLENIKQPEENLLKLKCVLAEKIVTHCRLCERKCGVNRKEGEKGFCKAGLDWKIFGAHAHYGEEAELVPSGTIFQAGCSMKCVYCQNAPESMTPELGETWKIEEVARWIEKAKEEGMRNCNLVGGSPTIWLFNIINALKLVNTNIPIVWNSNAYYSEETAKLIDGIVDIYLLDFRYFSEECARKLSFAPNYPEVAKRNHLLAAKSGELLIRILVMPNHLECDAKPIIKWIKENLGEWTRVNILSQYRPCWKAFEYEGINRPLSYKEWKSVVEYAREIGMKNLVEG
jgi:putative pyruvate formate lyase activating enzyme